MTSYASLSAREKLEQNARQDEHGIWRWQSNGSVPPEEIMREAKAQGIDIDLAAHDAARDIDITRALAKYREARANLSPELEAEMAFERRAAFGPDVEVVDIVTGTRYRT